MNPTEILQQYVLSERPNPEVDERCFALRRTPLPTAAQVPLGHLLLRVRSLSIDPYVRARLEDRPSYKPPISLGDVIPGQAVAEVLCSTDAAFEPGDVVLAHSGWTTHALVPASDVTRVPANIGDPQLALGALGMPGLTAFAGLAEYGRLRAGETIVVGAATGPVGSMVGQLARLSGLRTVGIAGGREKCRVLREELGFDAAVDHRDPGFAASLRTACPDGIDVDFETVGGRVFDAIMPLLNRHARVIVCGLVGQWVAQWSAHSAWDLLRATLDRSLTVSGFVVGDLASAHRRRFDREVPPLVHNGSVIALQHVTEGLASAPAALVSMLRGQHIGKTVVRVA